MNINLTTAHEVGDIVFIKSQLDYYLDTEGYAEPWIYFYLPDMYFTVTKIKIIEDEESGNDNIYYELEKVFVGNPEYKASQVIESVDLIAESNLYSKAEGITKINEKITNFQTYLSNL